MKRLGKFLAIMFLVVPMVLGIMFLSPNLTHNVTQTAQNGGGGDNLLDSPKIGNNSEFDNIKNDELPSDNDSDIETEWTTPTYKTEEDWFLDFEVPEKIAGTTIGGAGTAASPYVLNSLTDLLFVTRMSSLYNKHIKLNCDITLNEEKFDKDGNPSGGDGVIRPWCGFVNAYYGCFDMGGHTIKGLYVNRPEVGCSSFIRTSNTVAQFDNAIFENVYLVGLEYVGTIGMSVRYCKNVVVKSGYIYAKNAVGGVCWQTIEMENVTNYATVSLTEKKQYASGLVACGGMTSLIKNCVNYGDVSGHYYTSGIVTDIYGSARIIGCKNYGNIYGTSLNISGIVSVLRSSPTTAKKILNCQNYGTIAGSGNRSGILSYCDGSVDIIGCRNYGAIDVGGGASTGVLIGRIATVNADRDVHIRAIDCEAYSINGHSVFGYAGHEGKIVENFSLTIKRCKFYSYGEKVAYPIAHNINHNFVLSIENSYFYIKNYAGERIIQEINTGTFLNIKNTIFDFNTTSSDITFKLPNIKTSAKINFDNVIATLSNNNNEYFGSDFSAFSVDYKTGKIGLKVFSGKGFYQGTVSEDTLIGNGYKKSAA